MIIKQKTAINKVAVFVSYELMFLTFVLAQSIDVLHKT